MTRNQALLIAGSAGVGFSSLAVSKALGTDLSLLHFLPRAAFEGKGVCSEPLARLLCGVTAEVWAVVNHLCHVAAADHFTPTPHPCSLQMLVPIQEGIRVPPEPLHMMFRSVTKTQV